MKILFEDYVKAPSSVLLSNSYYGINIEFSGGCHKLASDIKRLLLDGDNVLAFVDVVPNNQDTIKLYESLQVDFSKDIDSGRLVLCPILCIEYYILRMLVDYGYLDVAKSIYLTNLIVRFNYSNEELQNKINQSKKWVESLERFLKYVLINESNRIKQRCIKNNFEYEEKDGKLIRKPSINGIFYEKDCNCERKYCRLNSTDDIGLKAERLYTSLPIFYVEDDIHRKHISNLGIDTKDCDLELKFKEIQEFYDLVCDELGVSRIKI